MKKLQSHTHHNQNFRAQTISYIINISKVMITLVHPSYHSLYITLHVPIPTTDYISTTQAQLFS